MPMSTRLNFFSTIAPDVIVYFPWLHPPVLQTEWAKHFRLTLLYIILLSASWQTFDYEIYEILEQKYVTIKDK